MNFMRSKNLLMTALFFIALILSAWAAKQMLKSSNNNTINQPNTPDSFMTAVDFTHFNNDGQWQSRFSSSHALHYPANDATQMDNPKLIARGENQLVWFITAVHGTSVEGGKTIYLKDQVQVRRNDQQTQRSITMTTSALTAYPKRNYVETNQPVTITQPGSIIHAIGLTADLNTADLRLLSQTHGTYEQ